MTPHTNRRPLAPRIELRRSLERDREELRQAARDRIREVRVTSPDDNVVGDLIDSSEADIQSALQMSLLEMQGQRLQHIEEALQRLDNGSYGSCVDCGADIAPARLQALPFAVRCLACQDVDDAVISQQPVPTWRHHGVR